MNELAVFDEVATTIAKWKADADAKELTEKKRKEAEVAKEQKRISNERHRETIEGEAHFGLTETGHLGGIEASEVLEAIKGNRIPHISINY